MGRFKDENLDPAEAAWRLFEKTGKPSYYALYKRIKGD